MPEPCPITLKEKVRRLPHAPGVYLMKDQIGQTIYVGKAKDLKKRVSTYFQASRKRSISQPKVRTMIGLIEDFETVQVKSEAEALLLEGQLIKKYRPRYNTDFTDDKKFLLVRVDPREPLPRFRLTRNRVDSQSRHYGPFAHSGDLRKTLAELRRRFGVLLSDAKPVCLGDKRWKLYDDARQELYDHANVVTETEYAERVEAACRCLEGKARDWLSELKEKMQSAADRLDYENAALLRDRIDALQRTAQRTRKFERNLLGTQNGPATIQLLKKQLHLPLLPRHMECFDISHISGSFCVASMVHFLNGRPDRKNYRRYRIKSFVGNDDFRAMEEVVRRRYQGLHEAGKSFPDLIIIDGGAGQVNAALKAFIGQELTPPPLIGLAKKRETIIFSDGRPPVNLSFRDPALRLLQHIRDEAHQFANRYSADLRSQRLKESILSDFSGIGPEKRMRLLEHFGSINKLKAANAEQLSGVEGIGTKTAIRLAEFFSKNKTD